MKEAGERLAWWARPSTRKAFGRTLRAALNGVVYLSGNAAKPTMGNVAKDLVLREGKLEVWRVRRSTERYELGDDEVSIDLAPPQKCPILLIPPLMVRPYVYDLRPEHSMMRTLRNAGFDVFYLDFGVPDRADEGLRLDDYVTDFVPRAVDRMMEVSGAKQCSLVGYCMGGIFALLHVAAHKDPRVAHIVTIGAPVDFDRMGAITIAARLGGPLVDPIVERLGNIPGKLSSAGFKLLSGTRSITKYLDLFSHLSSEDYVRSFDSIDTWLSEMIPYPKEAFRQLVQEVVRGNKMLKDELVFRDKDGIEKRSEMRSVSCPLLAFAGVGDNVATLGSTREILNLVSSQDKTFLEVPGGHIGVVGGSQARVEVWEPMISWLRDRQKGS
ncbi:MAG: alpha/beta fold hydrolase [Polyangiaceae bacterium]|nr:alpha/beta fold hydrolase [Polyangiaceae bacterium]